MIERQAEATNAHVHAALEGDGDVRTTLTDFAANLLRLLLGERALAISTGSRSPSCRRRERHAESRVCTDLRRLVRVRHGIEGGARRVISFFPVIVDTAAGLASVDSDLVRLFRSINASRWQALFKLKLPAALPHVFAGLKTAAVFSVVGVIVGEFLGGGAGMGELLRVAAGQLRLARVFAFVLVVSVLGLALFTVLARVERRVVYWRHDRDVDMAPRSA